MEIDWPFRASEALDADAMTYRELRRFHRAEHPAIWVPRGVDLTLEQRARAAWLWSGRRAVVAGLAASALLGARWIDADVPVELVHTNRRPPPGVIVHSDTLHPGETQCVGDLTITTPARAAFDLGRRMTVVDGVQRIDALVNATGLLPAAVVAVMARHPHVRGLKRLREVLELADGGAESPYESMTRLLLIRAGFPRPQTQIKVYDEWGEIFARIDMGWPEYLVGVDFEGAHHWSDPRQRSWDIERFAELPKLGWIDERLTSGILHHRPQSFLDRVGAAPESRGCPRTW